MVNSNEVRALRVEASDIKEHLAKSMLKKTIICGQLLREPMTSKINKSYRIHVVGSSPRSGTTLAFELLTSCFKLDKYGDHEVSIFYGPKNAVDHYASKKPTDLVHICRLMKWDPNLYVIYMQRDPRDVIVSRHGSKPEDYWCDYPMWAKNQKLLSKIEMHPRFYICRYEELVTHPDIEQNRIESQFPFLIKLHNFSSFGQVAQSSESAVLALKGVRNITSASIGAWKRNLPRIASQWRKYPEIEQALIDTGYEYNNDWTKICKDVHPDDSESIRSQNDLLRNKNRLTRFGLVIVRRLCSFKNEFLYICGYRKSL